ncbi:hypothetical protein P8T65_29695 [Streptomyces sp. 11x1]|nr:hypothetical protein [Streptomyces sp. 11x1]WNZ14861.1 hypothetical protein P8T65_29695 [Streptomyces sp. 11x1]
MPVKHRFDSWCELMHRAIPPSLMSSEFADDFWARQRLMELGPVLVGDGASGDGVPAHRKLVRQSDPEMYHLSLVLGGGR